MRPYRLALPAVLPLVLLVTGCSGSSDPLPSASSPSPSSTPSATASATSEPTATATPTQTATARPAAKDGDVDGDGKADTATTTADQLQVRLSSTGAVLSVAVHADAPRPAPVLGITDVDGDGYAEVFLETAQGASTRFATPYRFDGTALREVQLDGVPARLGFGGSVRRGEGFRCTGGQLEVRKAESQDGKAFTVTVTTYRLGVDALEQLKSSTVQAKQGDAAVQAAYTASCGPVGENG